MIIRMLRQEDRAIIADIHCRSWQQSYRGQMPVDFLDTALPQHMRTYWAAKDIAPRDICLVAEDADEIVGFVAAWDAEPVYLDNLHVASSHRSSGIGRALMREVAIRAQTNGRKGLDLHVVIGNDRAQQLYQKMGGVITATENKPLAGIDVPHYRIGWPNVETLIAKTMA